MLKEKIREAYAKVQEDRQNAAEWNAIAKEDMKLVDTLITAQKKIDPAFDKKAFLAELDNPSTPTDPDQYLAAEFPENPEN